jgi:tripartite-type tricarboxylate transporter receptor subunit TctC
MQEEGFANYNFDGWWGAFVPVKTPAPVVAKLAGLFAEINRGADTRNFLETASAIPLFGDAEWMRKQLTKDTEIWGQLSKASNLQPQ